MRQARLAAAAATAGSALIVAPAPALAHSPLQRAYERTYHEVAHQLGRRAPGRNIVRWGLPSHRAAPPRILTRSLSVLHRMLAPPAPPRVGGQSAAVTPASVSATPAPVPTSLPRASVTGALPACASESGTNYSTGQANTNGSSGATGRYQITPGTAANYGCSLATPAGQDACAQTIYEHQGAGAWVGCGG